MSRREYGAGTIFPNKNGTGWIGRMEAGLTPAGTRRRIEVSGKTEAEARRKLKAREREYAKNAHAVTSTITVQAWAATWLEAIVKSKRPKSFATDQSAVNRWIVPTIGRRRLDQLTRADLRRVQDAQRNAGLAPSSIRRTHTVLVKMLKDAHGDDHQVAANVLTMPAPPVGENDRMALPPDDLVKMLRQVADADDPSRWIAALFQGLRPGERLGLTWPLIDFDNDVVDISWQLQALPYIDVRDKARGFRVPDGFTSTQLEGRWHLVRPKTKSGRRFTPMTPWFRSALLEWRDRAPTNDHDLVWCTPSGSPIDPADALADWKAMQDAAGVSHPTREHFVVHEGRHTTATLLSELGVSKDVIIAILGHASYGSTRIYVHDDLAEQARAAMRKLHARLVVADPGLLALEAS